MADIDSEKKVNLTSPEFEKLFTQHINETNKLSGRGMFFDQVAWRETLQAIAEKAFSLGEESTHR